MSPLSGPPLARSKRSPRRYPARCYEAVLTRLLSSFVRPTKGPRQASRRSPAQTTALRSPPPPSAGLRDATRKVAVASRHEPAQPRKPPRPAPARLRSLAPSRHPTIDGDRPATGDHLNAPRRRGLRVKRNIKSRHKPISIPGDQTRRSATQIEGASSTPLTLLFWLTQGVSHVATAEARRGSGGSAPGERRGDHQRRGPQCRASPSSWQRDDSAPLSRASTIAGTNCSPPAPGAPAAIRIVAAASARSAERPPTRRHRELMRLNRPRLLVVRPPPPAAAAANDLNPPPGGGLRRKFNIKSRHMPIPK